jgi:gliding motility-associated-like protein
VSLSGRLGLLITCILLQLPLALRAQLYCPSNINFENGNLNNWKFYIAVNNGALGLSTLTSTTPLTNRHVLTSGTNTDFYGGFPIVDPFGGNYSLRVGNDGVNAQVDQARYVFTVPTTVNNYSLIYRYAVVFENPGHMSYDQPFFRVRVYDSATGAIINCASFIYVSQTSLPGFLTSSHIGQHVMGAVVYYRPWTTGSLNLTGQAGKTLVAEFTSADCAQNGHFGYGYVDLSCGLFSISASSCNPTSSMSAPFGFQTYEWYNANYTAKVDTGRTITVATPTTLTQYHVVLTPYPGYGCSDTLTTQIIGSSLAVNAGPDTMLCNDTAIQLQPIVTANGPPLTYNWAPAAGLNCTTCLAPRASPTFNTSYVLTVSDSFGCVRSDTVQVKARPAMSVVTQPATCFGSATGAAFAATVQGTPPYTYSWSVSPSAIGDTLRQLLAGTYIVTSTDARGCRASMSATITSPTLLSASISKVDSVVCAGAKNGKATVVTTGGIRPYNYSWSTAPAQFSTTAIGLDTGKYIVTVTDSNGCVDTALAAVFEPRPLSMSFVRSNPHCYKDTTGVINVSASGGTMPYQYAANAGSFSAVSVVNNLKSGAYVIHLRDKNGCLLDSTVQLVDPLPISVSLGVNGPRCFGDSTGLISISAVGGTSPFLYALGSGAFGINPVFTGLPAGNKIIHVRDTLGCILDSLLTITQPSKLNAQPVVSPVLCKGDSNAVIALTGIGGTSPLTYALGTGSFSSNNTFSGLKKGNYAFHVLDSSGCRFDTSLSLSEPAALHLNAAVIAPSCMGSSNGSISMSGVGGTAPYRFALNTGSYRTAGSFTGLVAGTYDLHIRDTNNCIFDTTISIIQPSGLSITTATTRVHCNGGQDGTAQVIVIGGTAPYAYSWTGTSQTGSTIVGLIAGPYSVTVTDAKGCTGSVLLAITQPAPIVGTVSVVAPQCFNTATGSATVAVSGGVFPYTYAWSTTPVQTNAAATSLSSGSYSVIIIDSMGCRDTIPVSVPQTPAMVVSISTSSVSCNGLADGTATAAASSSTTPYTYLWNTTPPQNVATATGLKAGTYSVVATSAAGCTGTNTVTITQPTVLVVAVADSGTCKGQTAGVLQSKVTGGTSPYAYYWNTLPVQIGADAIGLPPGTFRVLVVDSKGCRDSAAAKVLEYDLPIIDAGPAHEICLGERVPLYATGAVNYEWSPAASLSCTKCAEPYASPTAEKTLYTVRGIDAHNCEGSDTVSIFVVQHVPVGVDQGRKICEGDTLSLQAWGGVDWLWLPASGLVSQNAGKAIVRPQASGYFQVVITENRCFRDTIDQYVDVVPLPVVDLGPDLQAPIGSELPLHAKANGAVSIEWIPADGLSCDDCFDPVLKVHGDGYYVAIVRNELGCSSTDTVHITDVCDQSYFHFPNVFTPNGDGQNDRFFPQGVASTLVNHFMIYDRWGEIVFSAKDIYVNDASAGWDGTYKGQTLKPDVYVYVMDAVCAGGNKVVIKGDVSLIR